MKTHIIKLFYIVLIIGICMSFVLIGCGKNVNGNNKDITKSSTTFTNLTDNSTEDVYNDVNKNESTVSVTKSTVTNKPVKQTPSQRTTTKKTIKATKNNNNVEKTTDKDTNISDDIYSKRY